MILWGTKNIFNPFYIQSQMTVHKTTRQWEGGIRLHQIIKA